MDVARMFEDLEATVGFQDRQASTVQGLITLARSASVRMNYQVFRLQRLVFAADFLLGQHKERTVAVRYSAIQEIQLQTWGQTGSRVSKIKLSAWVKSLPQGLRISVVIAGGERHAASTVTTSDDRFLCLQSQAPGTLAIAVPYSTIQCIEVDAVDNTMGLRE